MAIAVTQKAHSLNSLAAELCSSNPDKVKLKKLCSACSIEYSADLVELMSAVLFELSESTTQISARAPERLKKPAPTKTIHRNS